MLKKTDIRFLLYKIYEIHNLVFKLHQEDKSNDAYYLVLYEYKIYKYLDDNLEKIIKVNTHYLEYSTLITHKLLDIKFAIDFFEKLNCQKEISNNTKKELLILQKKNLLHYFPNIEKLDFQTAKTLYYIFKYTINEIYKLDKSFILENNDIKFLKSFSPFISQIDF